MKVSVTKKAARKKKSAKSTKKKGAAHKGGKAKRAASRSGASGAHPIASARRGRGSSGSAADESLYDVFARIADGLSDGIVERVQSISAQAGELPLRIGKEVGRLLLTPRDPKLASQAGSYLRELRELAGLTISEVSDAIDLRDQGLLRSVENGTATLSFELILRLAAIYARHDPVPFVMRFTRTYNPEIWELLQSWGVDRIPLQFEREREFINIYRRHDAARKLSEGGFARVLDFTRAAFDMSLHFVAEQEHVEDEEIDPDDLEA